MQRPTLNEKDIDLIKQNESFKVKLKEESISPAANVSNICKRKNHESVTHLTSIENDPQNAGKPKGTSRFAQTHSKKKKSGIVDNTVLNEAVKKEEGSAVLMRITPRNVPTIMPNIQWQPSPSPHGFPQPPKLELKDPSLEKTDERKRSLYMRQINDGSTSLPKRDSMDFDRDADEKLKLLGAQSVILSGQSGLGKSEADKIHDENMSRLGALTHTERIKERNELMSRLDSKQLEFLLSLRNKDITPQGIHQTRPEVSSTTTGLEDSYMEVAEENVKVENADDGDSIEVETYDTEKSSSKEKSVKFNEEVSVADLPITPEEASKWAHMDKVELNKLKWMTDVPKPKPLKGKEGYVARFNFDGDLLPYDADISWREGLHHHGDEPGRAGYALDELFILVRSQVLQQRHLGLKTLANILRNAYEGLYDQCFDTPIIQLMIDAGVVLLLRFALDETSAPVYQEALRALYYLVGCEADERCLSIAEPWAPLGVQPGFSSNIHSKDKEREQLDAEEKELKDVEVIKLDVVRALVRMDTHIRLRYFLESIPLSPPDVIHILGILKRVARHSLTTSWTLVQTPRLISIIVEHFIPHNISSLLTGSNLEQLKSVYGVPLSQALSLMKVVASRGRQIANKLMESYDLLTRIYAYISVEPTDIHMPLTEVLLLAQEAYNLWSIFLSYGFLKAQRGFSDFYPLLIKQLMFYRDKVDINIDTVNNHFNYELGAHFVNVLTKGLCVATTKSLLENRMKKNVGSLTNANGKEIVLQPPILSFESFSEILVMVEICLAKWMDQLKRDVKEISFSGFKLLGSFCNFVNIYYSKWRDQDAFEGDVFDKKLESLHGQILSTLFNESLCGFLFKKMRAYSSLCSSLKLGKLRDPVNLGSLWSICEGGKVVPVLQSGSPFPFILPITTLLRTTYSLRSSFERDQIQIFLSSENLKRYFLDICDSYHNIGPQYFTRIELYVVANILQLCNPIGFQREVLHHKTALTILPLVHKGDEHIIKSLLKDIVCNVDFAKDLLQIETQISNLKVEEFKPLKSPAFTQPTLSPDVLTQNLVQVLPLIGQSLITNLLYSKSLERSLVRNSFIPFLTNDLFLDQEKEIMLLDYYWCLRPLRFLFHLNESKGGSQNVTQPETILNVTKWLQMTFFILKYRQSITSLNTSPTGWFLHLSYVFLSSNDLFLDANINSYTQSILFEILTKEQHKNLDCSLSFPGMQPMYEWYKRMIDHFSSVAYGDSSFALFIIIPLLRSWPSCYKLLLFGEHSDALSFIRLTPEEVSQFIPHDDFFLPFEDSQQVLNKYKFVLSCKLINESRNPFLYHFVLNHIKKGMIIKEK